MFRHNPQGLEFGTTYRTDSASGSDTPVTVYTSDGTLSPIAPTVGASGSTMQEHDPRGGDTVFYSSLATVYLKPVNYYNGTPTGTGILTSTGSTAPSLPTGSPAAQYAVDPAFTGTYATFKSLARTPDALITGAITRDASGSAISATVTWPDGTTGTYTATTVSTAFPGAVDAYTITYGSPATKTYTQAAITRDATTGVATNVPAIVVS